MSEHIDDKFSKDGNEWDFSSEGWVGGHFPARNSSGGYHAIQKQWWDFYLEGTKKPKVLLVSESKDAKDDFQKAYPDWRITTTDLYDDGADLKIDICKKSLAEKNYNLIICQATLEHLYNPLGAIDNMFLALKNNGILILHTHAPGMPYHQWPKDYFRFMKDWFYDLPIHYKMELMELYLVGNCHYFICYRKV